MPEPDPYTQAFGAYLKDLRRTRRLTQEELAKASRLSPDSIRRLERGSLSPSIRTLSKLCEGLRISLSSLFTAFEIRDPVDTVELESLLRRCSKEDLSKTMRMVKALMGV